MDRKEIIEAAKHCATAGVCKACKMCDEDDCIMAFAKFIEKNFKEKEEPAPSANDTSSKNNNLSQYNDSMVARICQEGILNLLDTCYECNTVEKEYLEGYLRALADILHLIKEKTKCQ